MKSLKYRKVPFHRLSVSVPPHVFKALNLLAQRAELSISEIVRNAIVRYISSQGSQIVVDKGRRRMSEDRLINQRVGVSKRVSVSPPLVGGSRFEVLKERVIAGTATSEEEDEAIALNLIRLKREQLGFK